MFTCGFELVTFRPCECGIRSRQQMQRCHPKACGLICPVFSCLCRTWIHSHLCSQCCFTPRFRASTHLLGCFHLCCSQLFHQLARYHHIRFLRSPALGRHVRQNLSLALPCIWVQASENHVNSTSSFPVSSQEQFFRTSRLGYAPFHDRRFLFSRLPSEPYRGLAFATWKPQVGRGGEGRKHKLSERRNSKEIIKTR